MDLLSQPLLWCIVQVTLVALLGWLLCTLISRMSSPGAAVVPAAALAAVVLLTASAFAPWPHWWRFAPQWQSTTDVFRSPVANARGASSVLESSLSDVPSETATSATLDESAFPPIHSDFEQHNIQQHDAADSSFTRTRFWSWLPALAATALTCGAVLGLLQLTAGLLSVRRIRKASHTLHDSTLTELTDCLRAELCLQTKIELRECEDLTTAATIGWIHPVILLPPTWREWTEDQLRAVLAHELAHVARGDFFACVLAQLCLALHFYHPLVHWLAARLRLEQELAADATAAALAGGRKTYLHSLAELALHNSERSLGWPAHTFLPTQGTFLRRIEMLRDSREVPTLGSGRGKIQRWAAVGLLIVGAMVIAGLRTGPAPSPFDTAVHAQQPSATEGQKAGGIDLSYVSNDARFVVAVRPTEIMQVPEIKTVVESAVRDVKPFALLAAEGIEQVIFTGSEQGAGPGADEPLIVIQFSKPATLDQLVKIELIPADAPRVTAGAGAAAAGHRLGYGVINDRTYAVGNPNALAKYLGDRRKGEPAIAAGAAWEKVRKGAVVVAVDMQLLRKQLQHHPANAPGQSLSAIAPLWNDSEYVVAGILIEGKTAHVRAIATCHDTELAERVAETAVAAKTLAQNLLRATQENERDIPAFAKFGLDTAEGLLKSVKVERSEKLVFAQTSTDLPKAGSAAATNLLEAVSQSRIAARRTVSANNMKQIMLAMHNWAEIARVPGTVENRFPAPVIMGKDGKGRFPHSWRVAILPFIEQVDLYNQYNFDEPWDSEANKRVLEKMPAVYRNPADDPKSTTSAYYVLTGSKLLEEKAADGGGTSPPEGGFPTAFSAKNGMLFSQITDGMSNTIAVVEAKTGIPWTKPEDIVIDPAKDLPKLGGITEGGFYAALCDGSVRFLKSNIDPKTLKLLIMPGDGQILAQE
jgi:beta-lactamase regulating signal transducer with metallopeptidase domain